MVCERPFIPHPNVNINGKMDVPCIYHIPCSAGTMCLLLLAVGLRPRVAVAARCSFFSGICQAKIIELPPALRYNQKSQDMVLYPWGQ